MITILVEKLVKYNVKAAIRDIETICKKYNVRLTAHSDCHAQGAYIEVEADITSEEGVLCRYGEVMDS